MKSVLLVAREEKEEKGRSPASKNGVGDGSIFHFYKKSSEKEGRKGV